MYEPAAGGAGEVSIFCGKQRIGLGVVFGLYQPAVITDFDLERKIHLGARERLFAKVRVRRRGKTQIQKSMLQRRSAMAAVHKSIP